MGIVIAVLLTLAIAGSVLWVMPSAREKSLIEMRQVALGEGVRVRLLDEATALKLYPWLDNHRGYVHYECPLMAGSKWPFDSPQVVPVDLDSLHELDRNQALHVALKEASILDQLPDSAEAVTCYSHAVAVLWREREGAEGAERVCQVLKEVAALSL